MQSILIDMARTWRRLALEVEQQSSYKEPNLSSFTSRKVPKNNLAGSSSIA
jgi:hypothetical protein